MDWIEEAFSFVQQWLFETLMQPAMFALGLGHLLEDGYAATGWLLVGLIQIAVLVAVIGPLAALAAGGAGDRPCHHPHRRALHPDPPAGPVPGGACSSLVDPLFDELFGMLRVAGFGTFHLDQLWPGVTDQALVELRASTWSCSTSWTTGCTGRSTASTGGGACIRCTTRSAR